MQEIENTKENGGRDRDRTCDPSRVKGAQAVDVACESQKSADSPRPRLEALLRVAAEQWLHKSPEDQAAERRFIERDLAALEALRPTIPEALGLTWREYPDKWEARWLARTDIAAKGFPPRSVRLWIGKNPTQAEADQIAERCRALQADMLAWSRCPDMGTVTPGRGYVYFATDGERIKIGHSELPKRRVKHLGYETGKPVRLLYSLRASIEYEKELHRKFAELRVEGEREWYRDDPRFHALIQALKSNHL